MMKIILLSASIPDVRRDPKFWQPDKFVLIRESIRALASVVLPKAFLIFGGHPAITPIVRQVGARLDCLHNALLFQSAFFEKDFPFDNRYFTPGKNYIITDPLENRDKSLKLMRSKMICTGDNAKERKQRLGREEYDAAIFIGGMEGVIEEFNLFRQCHPQKPTYPVASTGAAAGEIAQEIWAKLELKGEIREALMNDTVYGAMFERLLFA